MIKGKGIREKGKHVSHFTLHTFPSRQLLTDQVSADSFTATPLFAHNLRLYENMTRNFKQVIVCEISHLWEDVSAFNAGVVFRNVLKPIVGGGLFDVVYKRFNVISRRCSAGEGIWP